MHLDYKQPSFYKFNEDSIILAHYAKSLVKEGFCILDLCAGCGVVGIELLKEEKLNCQLDFLELQKDFLDVLELNLALLKGVKTRVFNTSIGKFNQDRFYHLIISNPPYFNASEGRKSPVEQRQRSRSFEVDSAELMIDKSMKMLTQNGVLVFSHPIESSYWKKAIDKRKERSQTIAARSDLAITTLFKCDIDK